MLTAALAIAALAIGVTGAWSPCGLSMVETIGPTGHTGGRRTTLAALASFVPGAMLGGVATFGALALAGDLVFGAGGQVAYLIAGGIALLAALAEARGLRIVPQIRRQVPEHWRRVMPLPLAAFGYGILLGLGFTTFVLSFGVWALAGISFALGDPVAGVAIGLSFGAGRALPVLVVAPICDRPLGVRVTELMTQSPAIYRGFRLGDALALAVVAAVTVTALPAGAAVRSVSGAGEPSAGGQDLAYQRVVGGGVLRRGGSSVRLPGGAPAVGGPFIAVRQPGEVVLLGRRKLGERGRFRAPGADGLAVSGSWIAYRARRHGHDVIRVRRIFRRGISAGHPARQSVASAAGIAFGPDRVAARSRRSGGLSRPGLFRSTLVYSSSSRRRSSIVQRLLGRHRHRVLVRSRRWLVSDPSVWGRSFAYVRTTNERQQLRVRRRSRRGKGKLVYALPATSYRDRDHDPGHVRLHTREPKPDLRRSNWNLIATAIAPGRVYATLLREGGSRVRAKIIRTGR
jgi:hypothetical protein